MTRQIPEDGWVDVRDPRNPRRLAFRLHPRTGIVELYSRRDGRGFVYLRAYGLEFAGEPDEPAR